MGQRPVTVVGQWAGGAGNAGQWRGLEAAENDREEKQQRLFITEQRKEDFWGAPLVGVWRLWWPANGVAAETAVGNVSILWAVDQNRAGEEKRTEQRLAWGVCCERRYHG